jgi:hypothetical protein
VISYGESSAGLSGVCAWIASKEVLGQLSEMQHVETCKSAVQRINNQLNQGRPVSFASNAQISSLS